MTPRRITFALLLVLLACMVAGAQRVLIDRRSVAAGGGLSYVSGLVYWLKPESITGSNGDDFSQWSDSSGNLYHAYAPSTQEPMVTNSAVNGFSAVVFDAAITSQLNLSNVLTGLDAAEMFLLLKAKTTSPVPVVGAWSFSKSAQGNHYPYLGNIIFEIFGGNTRYSATPTEDIAAWHIYNVWIGGGLSSNFVNNVTLSGASSVSTNWTSAPKLGRSLITGAYFDGQASEMLFYDHKLSEENRVLVLDYLSNKFGL